MLTLVEDPAEITRFAVPSSREAIVSWNTRVPSGSLAIRVEDTNGGASAWLPYVSFDAGTRRSHNGRDTIARIETDILRSTAPMRAVTVRSTEPLDALAVAAPCTAVDVRRAGVSGPANALADRTPVLLDVPARTQYLASRPEMRGWCSPTSLAMLLAYWGVAADIESVARDVHDDTYGGTGNWTFNIAYAAMRGLRGAVVYLRDLDHAHRFLAAGIPLALSVAWEFDTLPGAPLARSDGHLLVLCGFDGDHAIVNDPAHPQLRVRYERAAFAQAWLPHGGVAYAIAPAARTSELVALAADTRDGAA